MTRVVRGSSGPRAEKVVESSRWDESTRPVFTPPADWVTTNGNGQGQHLVEVHDHLRTELEKVYQVVDEVRRGSRTATSARSAINEMTVRQNNWSLGAYCATYLRLVTMHHSLEDSAVFPYLRAAEPALAPVLDRLEEEHRVVHDVLNELDRVLIQLLEHPGDLSGVDAALDDLTRTLRSHLRYEEDQLVQPLDRYGFAR